MGLSGLAIAYFKFQHFFQVSLPLGQALLLGTSAWFTLLLIVQLARLIRYPQAVKKDWNHPIRVNFFPALSICFLLLAIGYLEMGQAKIAAVLWYIGTPLHLVFLLALINRWFHQTQQLKTFNPAWFIPVVGPILVPVAGVQLANPEVSWFFFATGLVYWIVLLTVFFYRIVFHEAVPPKLLPTLFILIAPASVGFVAYTKLTGGLDSFGRILFYFGVFTALMLATMIGHLRKIPFFLSWWAFTFPLDALTLSFFLMFKLTGGIFFKQTAGGLLALTTVVVVVVLGRTIRHAWQGKMCVPED